MCPLDTIIPSACESCLSVVWVAVNRKSLCRCRAIIITDASTDILSFVRVMCMDLQAMSVIEVGQGVGFRVDGFV